MSNKLRHKTLESRAKRRLLDLCCCEGGAAMGYYRAAKKLGVNIEIIGVDNKDFNDYYPFTFVKGDAVEYLNEYCNYFDFIHASPPCQRYSCSTARWRADGKEYNDCLSTIRSMLQKQSTPAVIENVPGSPLRKDVVLRGDMFGLRVLKKRVFELQNWFTLHPEIPAKRGSVKAGDYAQVAGKGQLTTTGGSRFKVKGDSVKEVWSNAMGIDWMTRDGLAQAIPPDYTEYLGKILFHQKQMACDN